MPVSWVIEPRVWRPPSRQGKVRDRAVRTPHTPFGPAKICTNLAASIRPFDNNKAPIENHGADQSILRRGTFAQDRLVESDRQHRNTWHTTCLRHRLRRSLIYPSACQRWPQWQNISPSAHLASFLCIQAQRSRCFRRYG